MSFSKGKSRSHGSIFLHHLLGAMLRNEVYIEKFPRCARGLYHLIILTKMIILKEQLMHSNDSRLSSSEIYLSPWPVVHQAFPQDDQRAPRFHHGCEEKQKLTAHPHIQRSCCRSFPSNVKTLRKLESLETSNSAAGNPQGRYLSQDREKVP